MQLRPIAITRVQPYAPNKSISTNYSQDTFRAENPFVNKKPLVDRKIVGKDEDINIFFDNISHRIFSNPTNARSFSYLLKGGYISLSSNAMNDLKDPKSAIGIQLDENKSSVQHCAQLEKYVQNGVGVGINFSNFSHPINSIRYINDYFKYREPNVARPPAGIALLDINHQDILDFIKLKDNKDYQNWCFDLSVIVDSDFLNKVDNLEDIELSNGKKIKAYEIYSQLLNSMNTSGEPGIIFSDDKDFICDSCATSELKSNEDLTLAQINLSKFYDKKTNSINYDLLSKASNILSQALNKIASGGFISILGYQDLLNQIGLQYGEEDSKQILESCLKTIRKEASKKSVRMAISPTGTISRFLKTSPSIEPDKNKDISYWDELDTMALAQKYLDGGISKTILLKDRHTIQDINYIIRYCSDNGIKGISVFRQQ